MCVCWVRGGGRGKAECLVCTRAMRAEECVCVLGGGGGGARGGRVSGLYKSDEGRGICVCVWGGGGRRGTGAYY